MMKIFLAKTVRGEAMLALVFSCLFALSAMAQNAATTQVGPGSVPSNPARAIGPAPANSPQGKVLSTALSPQTRQTLLDAMNSVHPTDAAPTPASK